MQKEASDMVGEVVGKIDRAAIPNELMQLFQRHHENLIELAASLLANGKSVPQVKEIISTVLESFQRELARTITSLQEPDSENRA